MVLIDQDVCFDLVRRAWLVNVAEALLLLHLIVVVAEIGARALVGLQVC